MYKYNKFEILFEACFHKHSNSTISRQNKCGFRLKMMSNGDPAFH